MKKLVVPILLAVLFLSVFFLSVAAQGQVVEILDTSLSSEIITTTTGFEVSFINNSSSVAIISEYDDKPYKVYVPIITLGVEGDPILSNSVSNTFGAEISPGDVYTFTFNQTGVFTFQIVLQFNVMTGTIIIEPELTPVPLTEMVTIPGDNDVPEFEIDVSLVTFGQFNDYCMTLSVSEQSIFCYNNAWDFYKHDWRLPEMANYPVNGTFAYYAQLYCEWADKRLPNQHEWRKAAEGNYGLEDLRYELTYITSGLTVVGVEYVRYVSDVNPEGYSVMQLDESLLAIGGERAMISDGMNAGLFRCAR